MKVFGDEGEMLLRPSPARSAWMAAVVSSVIAPLPACQDAEKELALASPSGSLPEGRLVGTIVSR